MSEGFEDILAQAQSRVGRVLKDKWTLDRLVGVGGMAAVYAATHRNRKRVAVKMLHPELSMNASIRQRFLREGYVANSVDHPGAVAVDDDEVADDGSAFLVMELLDGETLDARWERKGKRLPTEEVLSLMDQVLDTLVAAHAKGIVHRDLKPENLFLTRSGSVKVLDFGIARVRELSQSSTKTQTGSTMGTPAFMPPEQARGRWEEVDGQSDLWAIGATIFTLLTGRYVHEAGTVNEALVFAVTARARSIGELRPDLPKPVTVLVDRALAYEKSERWKDAAEMQTALRRVCRTLDGEDWEDARVSTGTRATAESVADTMVSSPGGSADHQAARSVDSDIPPHPAPVGKPSALTTSRGIEQGGHRDSAERMNPRRRPMLLAGGAVLAVGIAAIGVFSLRSPNPTDDKVSAGALPNHNAVAAPTSPSAKIQVAPLDGAHPTEAVSLHDLPIARPATRRPGLPAQTHIELEDDVPPPNPYAATSAQRPRPTASASSSTSPQRTADPFAARR